MTQLPLYIEKQTIIGEFPVKDNPRYKIVISLVPTTEDLPNNVIDHLPDEEIAKISENYEQEQEWNNRNHSSYVDETRDESDV